MPHAPDTDEAADPKLILDTPEGALEERWRYLTVHEALGRILAELPAIGKTQENKEQHFMFRGIDDVLNALNPLLSKYGVFYVPDVLDRVPSLRTTRGGGTMYEVNLHVRFTFYGPAGDSVQASGWGEGTDMGDKSTNKAMTNAMKYVLFQTFAIATAEQSEMDNDRTSPEPTTAGGPPPAEVVPATEKQVVAILDRLRPLLGEDDEGKLVYPEEWRAARADGGPGTLALPTMESMVTGDRPFCSEPYAHRMNEVLDAIETRLNAELVGSNPCVLCGRTRPQRVLVEGEVRCVNVTSCKKHADDTAAAAANGGTAPADEADAAPELVVEDGSGTACTGCGELIPDPPGPVYNDEREPFHTECADFLK